MPLIHLTYQASYLSHTMHCPVSVVPLGIPIAWLMGAVAHCCCPAPWERLYHISLGCQKIKILDSEHSFYKGVWIVYVVPGPHVYVCVHQWRAIRLSPDWKVCSTNLLRDPGRPERVNLLLQQTMESEDNTFSIWLFSQPLLYLVVMEVTVFGSLEIGSG